MPSPSSTTKEGSRISATFPAHVRARIEEAAMLKGMPVSAFVAEAAGKEAQQVIERERLIELSRDDAETILGLLENPPKPNAALRKAAKLHKRLIRD